MNAGEGGVVHVTLRHTGRLNAMSRPMWRQLRAVFEDLQRRADARCVLIAGEGGAFCAGGDISEYPGFRFDAAALRDFHENDVWGGLNAMLQCDVPIVAQIRGACMGAGVEIASCCDIRVAGSGARFGAPIAKLGFPMAPREAQLVAGAVGDVAARQMLLSAIQEEMHGTLASSKSSALKLYASELSQHIVGIAFDIAGPEYAARLVPELAAAGGADDLDIERQLTHTYLFFRSRSIAGGTSEVQKNVIARDIFGG